MPAISKMVVASLLTVKVVTAPSADCGEDCRHAEVVKKIPILPVALQDDEITEGDFNLLVRIAEDPNAPTGRLRRPTSSIAAVKSVAR